MMNSTLNGFGFNTINPSFVNGFGGFVPGLNNFVPGFNGQSPIGLGWNNQFNSFGGVTPFGTINPSFVGGWNGLSPIGFNGLNTTSLFNTPFNTWNGFTGQSPVGLGWNGSVNGLGGWNTPFSSVTPFGGFMPFVSPINTFPGFNGYTTPSFNQGFVNTVNPTFNGGPISGVSNGPINTGNLYGQNTTVPSNGYNTPYANSVPYSPFGVQTSATCAHAA